jgi:hypothetical protein
VATIDDHIHVDPEERDIRLGDYLNDKLQIVADFASLDSLIANVEKQRSQLNEQVGTSIGQNFNLMANVLWKTSGC